MKIENKKRMVNQRNSALINALSPTAMNFEKSGYDLGDLYCVGMVTTRFPSKAQFGWLTDVCNLNNSITTITYTPEESPDEILQSISNTVSANTLVAQGVSSADPVEQARARKIVSDGTKIIEQIANNNESIGQTSITSIAIGNTKSDALNKAKAVKSKFGGRMFTLLPLPYMQKSIFKSGSPCDFAPELLNDVTNQILPMSTLLGGFPFSFSGYNDGYGCYYGKDSAGSLIIIDTWKRGRDRTNSNIVVMGSTGAGKSTAMKHLLLNEWEIGTKIVIIDPQGEYKDLCRSLDGDWIDVVGGGSRINPFHVYQKSKEDDSENDTVSAETQPVEKLSELAKHINNLEVFFNLYLSLTPSLAACLKECIELTYQQNGINWDTDISKIPASGYPIMEDLFNICSERAKTIEKDLKRSEVNYYKELVILLRAAAHGADKFLFNGTSTVSIKKDFVVFDTSSVNNTTANLQTTLYHTVLNYCEDYLYRNRNERVILVCDEAHMMIDKRLPETVKRLAKIEKTCRKFESAIWICSQQLIDFLDEAIKKEGQTLLDQPNIKLLMGVGNGRDLKELKELYGLTDAEEEVLMSQKRGVGLLFVGSRRLVVEFEIPKHHMELMGTGGGR